MLMNFLLKYMFDKDEFIFLFENDNNFCTKSIVTIG